MSAELTNGQLAALAGWSVLALAYVGALTCARLCGRLCARVMLWMEEAGPRRCDRVTPRSATGIPHPGARDAAPPRRDPAHPDAGRPQPARAAHDAAGVRADDPGDTR